ncbi:cyclic-phosphate processing receiver domain-containing protein [Paenibacillus eucommiae]|uniref:Cyclic-phosphate processing Receiver domain-containing protein n=1 Tax=Paenibacillus eucommiae TaxID=1355755 RepID=A0ABS4J5X7_9BACL|nr:cyclic-phosphate processing receiver domain-containing protein [Paenibacillus eucommiae]MBP1995232.1 hypothetical protein [Paenibacillus eucommiae]
MIHVYLDDMRPCPKGFIPAHNADECMILLEDCDVNILSLDHDLGWNQKNGSDVVNWMIEKKRFPKEIYLHSSSLPARKQMYERLYMAKPEEVLLYQIPIPEAKLYQIATEIRT